MKRWFIFSAIVVVLAISLTGWIWKKHKAPITLANKATPVTVTKVMLKTIPLTVSALGQVVAPKTIMLKTQTDGTVTNIYFKTGQIVTAGQLLLQLDPTAAKANEIEAGVKYNNLKTEYDRYVKLASLDNSAVSADLLSQKKNGVKAAKAAWQATQQQLNDTQVRAPFAGIIGTPEQSINQVAVAGTAQNEPVQLSVGSYLSAGSPIAILSNPNNMFVQYQVPQHYSGQLQIGQAVTIKSSAYPKQIFTGVVKYISPVVFQNIQAYNVVASINNSNSMLSSGMNVSVVQTLNPQQQILAVPGISLVPSLSGYSVYMIEDSKVKAVPVTIGQRYGSLVAILSGLKTGDNVITSGALNVHPGMTVTTEMQS